MNKARLETFSDSVIAIVITLLAFEFKVPLENIVSNYDAMYYIGGLIPLFLLFVLSFVTISIMWINHHYITSKIESVTHRTVWANSFLLLFISLIPFVTTFLGKNPFNQVALITYSLVMLLASLGFTFLKYSSVPKHVKTHGRERFKHVGVYVYTLAVIVAIVYPQLTYLVLVIPPLSYVLPTED